MWGRGRGYSHPLDNLLLDLYDDYLDGFNARGIGGYGGFGGVNRSGFAEKSSVRCNVGHAAL